MGIITLPISRVVLSVQIKGFETKEKDSLLILKANYLNKSPMISFISVKSHKMAFVVLINRTMSNSDQVSLLNKEAEAYYS